MKKTKLSPNVIEFKKQVKRIKQIVRRAEAKEIVFTETVIPEKPKRITKQFLEKLRETRPEDIRKKGFIVDDETGELIPYTKEAYKERKNKTKEPPEPYEPEPYEPEPYEPYEPEPYEPIRDYDGERPEDMPRQDDTILDNVMSLLIGAVNKNTADFLIDLLNDEIDLNGRDIVAERLAEASDRALELANGTAYASDSDEIANCAYSLATLISDNVTGFIAEQIEELAFQDRPYKRKR